MHSWKARLALFVAAMAAVSTAIASIGPARAAVESIFSCDSIKPCLQWNNSGSGDSIKGVSTSGAAIEGQTKFNSNGKTAGKSGMIGADVSTAGTLNSGVSGTSTNGTGVTGTETGSAGQNGVAGFSASTFGSGVYGQNSSTGAGVAGSNTSTSRSSGASGLLANGGAANDGIHSFAGSGNALYAFSQSGTALFANQGANTTAPELYLQDTSSSKNAIIQAVGPSGDVFDVFSGGGVSTQGNLIVSGAGAFGGNTSVTGNLVVSSSSGSSFTNSAGNNHDTLTVYAGGVGTDSEVFTVRDHNGGEEMLATDTGDVIIEGLLYSRGSCINGCMVGEKHLRSVAEYAPVETEPTIEDNGEATLTGGSAYVALDPKFANVIDKTAAYLVSVTPEGDCGGLFVAQRLPAGFTVRELRNGHDSLPFEYRIVAKRFGVQAPRLPMTSLPPADKPLRRH
ncbi:MAG TPA: hypothetical protein VII69_13530 [Candidatus Eremiobacteraceae bacterium]